MFPRIQLNFCWETLVIQDLTWGFVEWSRPCSPWNESELGICKSSMFDRALLGKMVVDIWKWQTSTLETHYLFTIQRNLWEGRTTEVMRSFHRIILWRSISGDWCVFSTHIKFRIGDGTQVQILMIFGVENLVSNSDFYICLGWQ